MNYMQEAVSDWHLSRSGWLVFPSNPHTNHHLVISATVYFRAVPNMISRKRLNKLETISSLGEVSNFFENNPG